jgi:hypothetical protein
MLNHQDERADLYNVPNSSPKWGSEKIGSSCSWLLAASSNNGGKSKE